MAKNQIVAFATANDTSHWIVSVDQYIQSFETKAEAVAVYLCITTPGGHFDDSGYGCCEIIKPWHRPINQLAKVLNEPEDMTQCLISEVTEINLIGYIAKHNARCWAQFKLAQAKANKMMPAHKRLADKREMDALWV